MNEKRPMLVRARALMGFAELVHAQGGDVAALLREVGLDPVILDQLDATLPMEAAARLLERAAELSACRTSVCASLGTRTSRCSA